MANNALASGSVVVTANADPMAAGLADAEKKAERSFEHTQAKLNKASAKWFKHEGGFLGAVGGGALGDLGFAAPVAAAVGIGLALKQTASAIDELVGYSKSFEKELESTQKFMDLIEKSAERTSKFMAEWRGAMVSNADVADSLQRELDETKNIVASLGKDLDGVNAKLKGEGEKTMTRGARFLFGMDADVINKIKARGDAIAGTTAKLVEKGNLLQTQLSRIMDPTSDPAAMGAFNRAMKATSDQVLNLGAKPWEKTLREFEKMGFPEHMLTEFRDASMLADEISEKFKEMEAATVTTAGRGGLFGLNKILTGTGIVAKELDRMSKMEPDKWKALTAPIGPLVGGALEAGSKEAFSLRVQNQLAGMGLGKGAEDANRENGRKIDDVKRAVETIGDGIIKALAEIGSV